MGLRLFEESRAHRPAGIYRIDQGRQFLGATDWYLIIDDMCGDVLKKGFKGAFKVDDFGLSVTDTGSVHNPIYEGLTVSFESGSAEDKMLRQLMTSKGASNIELIGRNAKAGQVVYDLRLSGAQLENLAHG